MKVFTSAGSSTGARRRLLSRAAAVAGPPGPRPGAASAARATGSPSRCRVPETSSSPKTASPPVVSLPSGCRRARRRRGTAVERHAALGAELGAGRDLRAALRAEASEASGADNIGGRPSVKRGRITRGAAPRSDRAAPRAAPGRSRRPARRCAENRNAAATASGEIRIGQPAKRPMRTADADAEQRAQDAARQAQHGRLDQELQQDVPRLRADRHADADLARALGHRHEQDVHDADAADQQRDRRDRGEQLRHHAARHERRLEHLAHAAHREVVLLALGDAVARAQERRDLRLGSASEARASCSDRMIWFTVPSVSVPRTRRSAVVNGTITTSS